MKFDEFKILVKGLKTVYTSPNFLPDADSIKIWYQLLQDISYEQLSVAIQKHMVTNKFPPTIAELREASVNCLVEIKGWADGWEKTKRAMRNYGYNRQNEAIASIDDDVAVRVVKRLGWKELCMSKTPMQDRANFRMIYEQESERQIKTAMLPESLRESIAHLQENISVKKIEGSR